MIYFIVEGNWEKYQRIQQMCIQKSCSLLHECCYTSICKKIKKLCSLPIFAFLFPPGKGRIEENSKAHGLKHTGAPLPLTFLFWFIFYQCLWEGVKSSRNLTKSRLHRIYSVLRTLGKHTEPRAHLEVQGHLKGHFLHITSATETRNFFLFFNFSL